MTRPRLLAAFLLASVLLVALAPHLSTASGPAAVAAAPPGEEAPPERYAHLRVVGADGALLLSTWPGERGALDPEERSGGPGRLARAYAEEPAFGPLLPMLHAAPANATVRIVNHTFGSLAIERVALPKLVELPRAGTLPAEAAARLFGNATAGETVHFLGRIPVSIESAGPEGVRYRLAVEPNATVPVTRSVGLALTALESGDELVRFALEAPSGAFTAHRNCLLPTQLLAPGYYVVEAEDESALHLVRYKNPVERALEGRTATVEATLLSPPAPSAAPHAHPHGAPPDHVH